jgi:hypothetical protein
MYQWRWCYRWLTFIRHINNILLLLVAAVALGLGIALDLGGKDTMADLIKTYQKQMEKNQKTK